MNTKQSEALKLALEAMRFALHVGFDESSESQIKKGDKAVQQHQNAIAAIREALAEQPAQEEGCQCPACEVKPHASDCAVHNEPAYQKGLCDCGAQQWNAGVPSLYPEPEPGVSIKATYERPAQQQEPELEPDAWDRCEGVDRQCRSWCGSRRCVSHWREAPPPASKPLTDAQIGAVAADIWGSVLIAPQSYQTFARAIEAAHGIKENNHE